MLYQLKNGRTVSMSLDSFLSKTDADFQDLEGSAKGSEISDPFSDSVLHDGFVVDVDLDEEPDLEIEHDLTELSPEQKLAELDMANDSSS